MKEVGHFMEIYQLLFNPFDGKNRILLLGAVFTQFSDKYFGNLRIISQKYQICCLVGLQITVV